LLALTGFIDMDDDFRLNGGTYHLLPLTIDEKEKCYRFSNGEIVGSYYSGMGNEIIVLTDLDIKGVSIQPLHEKTTAILKRQGWLA
jgi:hypothetical protein